MRRARTFRDQVAGTLAQCGRTCPDWWLSVWEEALRLADSSGMIAHAEIDIGDTRIFLGPESKEWGNLSPETMGSSPVVLHLYVADVDAVVQRAAAAGAKILIPVADQFYGDRAGRIADPFGHLWSIATHKEDVSPAEMDRRMQEWAKQQSGG